MKNSPIWMLFFSLFFSFSQAVWSTPTITQISPHAGPASGGTTVMVYGTGFLGATQVTFGANPSVFTVINDTMLVATTPAAVNFSLASKLSYRVGILRCS